MPKVSMPPLPLSGLFGVVKPSGPTSMAVIETIKNLLVTSRMFVTEEKLAQTHKAKGKGKGKRYRDDRLKVGQGGTLDPLADGVLVVAIGKGTKKLNTFLDCTKTYQTTCVLGCETDSYDSEGALVRHAPWKHVTRDEVEKHLLKFSGSIQQTPPIFSALKMDGKPLYEYARQGLALPRPIEARNVQVHTLELVEWLGTKHAFRYPSEQLSVERIESLKKALHSVDSEMQLDDVVETPDTDKGPSAFVLSMTVSGGTYVRSIVHDLAHSVGSAGYVATLQRSRQGQFVLECEKDGDLQCLPWELFEKASQDPGEVDEDGWHEWEREMLKHIQIVEGVPQQ